MAQVGLETPRKIAKTVEWLDNRVEELMVENSRLCKVLELIADDPCHAYAPARARAAIPKTGD